ncbi:DUF2218 domain-containing protein [Bosea beijingensis]|uniref:DUF2218 domain-containing protein n=1 Tax=Bosea beijingensis TaxID=3068632 RepID=UPI0027405682|nr:DUF2218 domain-containing protein [Bosea sp. REN20]
MTGTDNCQHSHAEVATASASRYLQQLCKHFGHKVEASFDEKAGIVRFSIGDCRLLAEADVLRLSLDAPDGEALLQLQDVVASHLVRFAFREPLTVEWRAGPAGSRPLQG